MIGNELSETRRITFKLCLLFLYLIILDFLGIGTLCEVIHLLLWSRKPSSNVLVVLWEKHTIMPRGPAWVVSFPVVRHNKKDQKECVSVMF